MVDDNPAVDEEQVAEQEQPVDEEKTEEQKADEAAAKLKEAISVETEEVGTLRRKLTITIPRETLDERLGDQFTELKRDSVVPGFRKGRAPLKLIEKRFGSEVGDQLVTQLVSSGYLAAVEKEDLKTLGDPLIWVDAPVEAEGGARRSEETAEQLLPIDKALLHMELPTEGPMSFSCEVELRPEFELPELEGIPIEKPKVKFTDDDVQNEVDRLRSMRGQHVPVEDAVQIDDLVVADVTMTIDGNVVREEQNVPLAARAQRLEGIALEGLGEALEGKKAGETVHLEAKIDDDHEKLEYRDKTAKFTLLIQDIKRLELPPVDEDFLESLGFDSEGDLREHIRWNLEKGLESLIQRGMRGQIGKYLLEKTEIDVPIGLSKRQTDRLVARRMIELYQRGTPEQAIQKQLDELRTRAGQDAVSELKLFFVMEKIAEQMEIDVADDEMNGEIARIAQQQGKRFDRVRDELAKDNGLTALYLQLRDNKILDALLDKAVVTEIERPKSEPKKGHQKKSTKSQESGAEASKDEGSSGESEKPKRTKGKMTKKKEAEG